MRPTSSLPRRSSEKAAALIIVIAFVVLITALAVAYLSHSTTDRQLAQSSFHDTDADLLARSALDIVIGDFKREIFLGSTLSGTNFIPTSAANVVPMRNNAEPTIPNLIRRSLRSELPLWPDSGVGPAVGSRASAVSSTPDLANPKRGDVTAARWNKHYLVPKLNAGDDGTEPIAAFTAPDWVLVTRNGPEVETSIGSGTTALNNPVSTNVHYVVGRYAYAVYDEGGLLDANLVGLPSPTPGAVTIAAPSPSRTAYISRKGTVAFADLTALPLTPGVTPDPTTVNKIVGWRNYATTTVLTTSTFPNLSPSPSPFVTYFLDNSRDFLTVNPITNSGRTDQAFATRSELIQLLLNIGDTNANANITNLLQYLGTFSRELNAPTWQSATNPISQRFQLDNISLLGSNPTPPPAPGSQTAINIQRYFGLIWSTETNRWQYVGTQGSSLLSAIPTPAPGGSPRPDFFQILTYAYSIPGPTPTIDKILSLGAAIIDQYDADEVTTGIEYAPAPNVAWGAEAVDPVIPMGSPVPEPSPTPIAGYTPVLNRPFQNVGELGYAYNPITDNTLNFKDQPPPTGTNADAALLGLFTYSTTDNTATYNLPHPLRAGPVNINTRNSAVIAAILTDALPNEPPGPAGVSSSTATTAANLIATSTNTQPAMSRQDLARLAHDVGTTIGTTDEQRETVARALSDTTQTRTWGLLIDLVAQTGHYPPNAQGLDDFVVEGEKHYWLHVAIDRFEGIAGGSGGRPLVEVLGQQREEVIE